MFESVNWIAVALAALGSFLIGGLWYSPALFLRPWQSDMNITDDQAGHPAKVFGLSYLFSLIACVFLAVLLGSDATAWSGARLGATVGFCAVFCSFGINYQFANRPLRTLLIDGGYHTAQFAVMGLIVGAWPG